MKRLPIFLFSFIFIISCSDNNPLSPLEEMKFREIAYNSLTDQQKRTIREDWQNAKIEQGQYKQVNGSHIFEFNSETYYYILLKDSGIELDEGQELVAVSFMTTDDSLLGPITMIIDIETERIIGFIGRL